MEPRISICRHWFLDNGFCSTDLPDDAPSMVPGDLGQEHMVFNDLGQGGSVVHFQGVAFHNLRSRVTIDADEPLLMIRALLRGRSDFVFDGVGEFHETPERLSLFVHGNPEDFCTSHHAANERMSVVGIMISASRLRAMCEGMDLPRPLEALGVDRVTNAMAGLSMSAPKRRLFTELVSNPYSGALSRLHSEGKVLEIVASILADLGGSERMPRRLLGSDEAKIKAACDYLLSSLTDLPSQEVLAREVGLPQRQLATAFRQATGMTMTEWTLEKKLERAAEMLLGGDLAVKEIAYRLGYAQVSTFTAAFSHRYGCPPASYRKSLITAHYL